MRSFPCCSALQLRVRRSGCRRRGVRDILFSTVDDAWCSGCGGSFGAVYGSSVQERCAGWRQGAYASRVARGELADLFVFCDGLALQKPDHVILFFDALFELRDVARLPFSCRCLSRYVASVSQPRAPEGAVWRAATLSRMVATCRDHVERGKFRDL